MNIKQTNFICILLENKLSTDKL